MKLTLILVFVASLLLIGGQCLRAAAHALQQEQARTAAQW
jgi:hypothetical protein